MSRQTLRTCRSPGLRRGFTLIEAVMSIVIVGVMLVAALSTIGALRLTSRQTEIVAAGPLLGQDLMNEIMVRAYEEPDETPDFGRETGEAAEERSSWDDVDDYDGWTASPPQRRDGTEIDDYAGWGRSVSVVWVTAADPSVVSGTPTGVKRITVSVSRAGAVLGSLAALRTEMWTAPTSEVDKPVILLVVADAQSLSIQDQSRKTLARSWGYDVSVISASATQLALDGAVASADVVYVVEQGQSTALGTKLRSAAIGVVVEEAALIPSFGFASVLAQTDTLDSVELITTGHSITSPFSPGFVTITSTPNVFRALVGVLAPGLEVLGEMDKTQGAGYAPAPALTVLETGAGLQGGGVAAGRRVQLPWGVPAFDIDDLTDDGRTLLRRSIDWAAGQEAP